MYCSPKFGQLILTKIIKIVAIRCQILRPKCTPFDFGWGSALDPAGEAYSALPDSLAGGVGACCTLPKNPISRSRPFGPRPEVLTHLFLPTWACLTSTNNSLVEVGQYRHDRYRYDISDSKYRRYRYRYPLLRRSLAYSRISLSLEK